MSLFSGLFSGRSHANSSKTGTKIIKIASRKHFLLGFVGAFCPPDNFNFSIEDDGTQLFESELADVLIRISSLSVKPETINLAIVQVEEFENNKNCIYVNGDNSKLVAISMEDGVDHFFYSSQIAIQNLSVFLSLTVLKSNKYLYQTAIVEAIKQIAKSLEICDQRKVAASIEEKNFGRDPSKLYSSFTTEEISNFKQGRLQSSRLNHQFFGHYPPEFSDLDKLFKEAVQHPNIFNGLDDAQIAIGFAVGDLLVSKHGFEWQYVEDDIGRDLAVVRSGEDKSLRIFPINFVQKRESIEDVGFIVELENFITGDQSP